MSFKEQRARYFTIEVTTSALCNLDCTYCFEGKKTDKRRLDDKVDLVKQRIYELLESEWFKTNYDVLNITFWGGEPTLNGDLIIDIMNEFSKFPNIDFHMYTNAYDRKRLDRIIDAVDYSKLHVQISYDGRLINDKFRITATGKPSSLNVISNMEYFARKGVDISLKSTIPITTMKGLYRTWKDFEQLHERMASIGDNIRVTYSPTIDYVVDVPMGDLPTMIEDFRKEIIMIAREELKFYKKHGRFLMTWFNASDQKMHCSSGANMHTIDIDGKTYACHGSMYSPNKEEMQGSDITKDSFVEDVAKMSSAYSEHIRDVSPICKGCVATTCIICPVASLDKSTKVTFSDRWTDRWVNNMCGFYKAFGEIDRTLQAYLAGQVDAPILGEN